MIAYFPVLLYLLFPLLLPVNSHKNNVCKNIRDYATINFNRHCWYNPDVDATPEDLITRYGFPYEIHNYITEDGFINTMFRIRHIYDTRNRRRESPVYIQHGFAANSMHFLSVGKRSLPFYLADKGYDVWLGNFRGSIHSRGHVNFTVKDPRYWNFSFHEVGVYDIPAAMELISEKTDSKGKIIYIGHSMGTTASFVYAILKKEHADKYLSKIIALCPVVFLEGIFKAYSMLATLSEEISFLLKILNIYTLFNDDTKLCLQFPYIIFCKYNVLFFNGYEISQIKPEDLPVFFNRGPPATSVKLLIHYGQIAESGGNFQFFDYGTKKNLDLYQSAKPPLYDLSKIDLPVHLFYGGSDVVATEIDVKNLYEKLKTRKTINHIAMDYSVKFNHLDFLIAKDIEKLLYTPMLNLMEFD